MDNFQIEYKLSLYEKLTVFSKTEKAIVELVQNSLDGRIYVRKILKSYNIDVFKTLQQIDSINIPKIYEVIEYENTLIVIEEFINGRTLQDILDSEGELKEDTVIKYTMYLCNILSEIHTMENSIIHRDIKPSNIILDNYDVIKLIDFDASRVYKKTSTRDTNILGTEGYAAPEQFGFLQTDSRSDIYSLGILMNMLITGKHPREQEVSGGLRKIIAKCIEINPKHRYKNTQQLKKDLVRLDNKNKGINIATKRFSKKNIDEKSELDIDKIPMKRNRDRIKMLAWLDYVPGFRTRSDIKQIIASMVYIFLTMALFMKETNAEKLTFSYFIENLVMVIMILCVIFLWTNFYDIQSHLPMLRNKNAIVKFIGYYLYSIFIVFVFGSLLSIVQ